MHNNLVMKCGCACHNCKLLLNYDTLNHVLSEKLGNNSLNHNYIIKSQKAYLMNKYYFHSETCKYINTFIKKVIMN